MITLFALPRWICNPADLLTALFLTLIPALRSVSVSHSVSHSPLSFSLCFTENRTPAYTFHPIIGPHTRLASN